LIRERKPESKYILIAKKIMDKMIKMYHDSNKFSLKDGGILMNCTETKLYFKTYVDNLNIDDKLEIVFKENKIARSSMNCSINKKGNLIGRLFSEFPCKYRIY